ncbi:hypothetical protein ODJ79_05170 [Actinoplanes sp. KI2]|uniref:hypothetical protein n=1 Tax=Actinoplanes sp. KI2 TaxID=2983315 RepID=UPI0021D5A9C3|nr:hypothetical protein [Actinoplanes sp. KI2]MCU7723098.1 hypothetical protein [Actinoplanes sp. KI2]
MLLQEKQSQVRTQPVDNRSYGQRPVVAEPARSRTYPPITWDHPSLGKVVADSIFGLSKSTVQLLIAGGVLVGSAVAIAYVITSVVSALGINAAASY